MSHINKYPQRQTLDGYVILNDVRVCSAVHVYMGEGSFKVREDSLQQRDIDLFCWNPSMRNGHGHAPMAQPFHYQLEGTVLGCYRQSFSGDPREPDYDNRIIRTLDLSIEYGRDGVRFQLAGQATVAGTKIQPRPTSTGPQGDWRFSAQFFVPIDRLLEVYRFNPTQEPYYREAMQKLPTVASRSAPSGITDRKTQHALDWRSWFRKNR